VKLLSRADTLVIMSRDLDEKQVTLVATVTHRDRASPHIVEMTSGTFDECIAEFFERYTKIKPLSGDAYLMWLGIQSHATRHLETVALYYTEVSNG